MTATSEAATRRRGPGRPWPKGVSGNPSGQPRDIPAAVAECRRLALAHVPAAVERLADMLDSTDERVVVAAACGLMDRAGVAPRAWEGERLEVVASVDVDALRAQLAARVAGLVQPALPPAEVPEQATLPAGEEPTGAGPSPARGAAQAGGSAGVQALASGVPKVEVG